MFPSMDLCFLVFLPRCSPAEDSHTQIRGVSKLAQQVTLFLKKFWLSLTKSRERILLKKTGSFRTSLDGGHLVCVLLAKCTYV